MSYTDEQINMSIVEINQKHQDWTWAEKTNWINHEFNTDFTPNAIRKRFYRQNIEDILDEMEAIDLDLKRPSIVNSIDSDIKTVTGSESVDELLRDAELSLSDWDVTNYNAWEAQTKEGIETLRSIRLKRRVDSFATDKLQRIVDELKSVSPVVDYEDYSSSGSCLFVPCLFDVHVGKPNRSNIQHVYTNAIRELIEKAHRCTYEIDQILFPIGNDMLQFDGLDRKTTAGTLVDSDLSMYESIDTACMMIIDAVSELQKSAPVHVAVIGGNHDRLASYWIGKVVAAHFYNNQNVTVDDSSAPRKYYRWHDVLIGMTHGNEEKTPDLAALMAIEAPEKWGLSKYREWLTGHLHKRSTMYHMINEQHGVTTRIIPSLCDSDSWHILKGFVGNHRIAEGLIYSSRGFEDQLGVNIGLS